MDRSLWHLIVSCLITPTCIWFYPKRGAAIIAADLGHPLWLVLAITVVTTAIGALPLYYASRYWWAKRINRRLDRNHHYRRLRYKYRERRLVILTLLGFSPVPEPLINGYAGAQQFPLLLLILSQIPGRLAHVMGTIISGLYLSQFLWFRQFIGWTEQPAVTIAMTAVVAAPFLWNWMKNAATVWAESVMTMFLGEDE